MVASTAVSVSIINQNSFKFNNKILPKINSLHSINSFKLLNYL